MPAQVRSRAPVTFYQTAIEAQGGPGNLQVQSPKRAASPVSTREISTARDLGGIDLRNLPIITQAFQNLSANIQFSQQELSRFASFNLKTEELEMEKLLLAELIPSVERLKEYLQASCYQDAISQNREKVMSIIAQCLRLEEDHSFATEQSLKDIILVCLEAGSPEQLKEVFLGQPS